MRFFFLLVSFFFLFSCSEYQKILKNTDPEFKYTQALNYYDNGDYARALQLFEDLLGYYRGDSKSEDIYYHYVYCNFYMQDYISAAYHFNNFVSKFILSEKNEEMSFMSAYCHYLDSPRFSLDQTNTHKAIDELQLFISNYPTSDSIPRVNELILVLNKKLEKKIDLLQYRSDVVEICKIEHRIRL